NKPIQSATALITALGVYEAALNNKRIGTAYFAPGWTSYDNRILYQQYDVSRQLKKGNNIITVTVGEGWYRGMFGGFDERDNYGSKAALLLQISIRYKDGSTQLIISDSSWQSGTGPILHSDIYGGEIFDTRKKTGNWQQVSTEIPPKATLEISNNEPVEKHAPIKPKAIIITPKGEQVIDFGQNLAGWVLIKVKGKPGDTITIAHAEILDKEGNFYTGNLRSASATDQYILTGNREDILEPHFTWHGFRYAKVEGSNAKSTTFEAIPLYSSLKTTGSFECSNPMLNQLQHNIEWSMKGNFLDIPTDCPQRSERLGWTGDAQVFFRTAAFNMHVQRFFEKWLKDLKADQREDGSVPNIIPNLYRKLGKRSGVAGWGDAATIIPWGLYWVYGDTAILQQQYESMKAWVDYIKSKSKEGLWLANGYGDWYAPGDSTSLPYIDQCFWAHSTKLLIESAKVLGLQNDITQYETLLDSIKTAFLKRYINSDGKAITHTQTAYVLALQLDMLPDSLQSKAATHLANLVEEKQNHLATGFLGTPHLLFALSKHGYTDLAFKLLNQDTYPSWLYAVKMGATTIWEKWDAVKPDSTVQATSYNHYSYGAVGDWLYRTVAGIEAASPGYKEIIIHPHVGGGLTWVKASYESAYGKIVSNWQVKEGKLFMEVEVPAGTTATIIVPGKAGQKVGEGKYKFTAKL
ncbi:MAG TPA: family 78 glycoside hydrolase catalytic domain, partial [Chitinophaga sp.]|uniref:family 78 glycoside hydrolase catalytic domain n=1 Tax=Chitinophaga sp. TaxID=1869181 RepID=UPI002F95CB35